MFYREVDPPRPVLVWNGGSWFPTVLRKWRRDDEGRWQGEVWVTRMWAMPDHWHWMEARDLRPNDPPTTQR